MSIRFEQEMRVFQCVHAVSCCRVTGLAYATPEVAAGNRSSQKGASRGRNRWRGSWGALCKVACMLSQLKGKIEAEDPRFLFIF